MKRLLIPTVAIFFFAVVTVYATARIAQLQRENAAQRLVGDEAASMLDASRIELARLRAENQTLREEVRRAEELVLRFVRSTLNRGSLLHYYPQPWWVQWLLAPFGSFRV